MHPHTKFGIPTSKNIGDMDQTQSGTDGQRRTVRLLYASQSSFGGIKKQIILQGILLGPSFPNGGSDSF